jgi:hypothetical protein
MIKANAERVSKYILYLRDLGEEQGLATDLLSDEEILNKFRFCFCCGEEVISKSEQMHSILEFNSPKRVHKKLYEKMNTDEN